MHKTYSIPMLTKGRCPSEHCAPVVLWCFCLLVPMHCTSISAHSYKLFAPHFPLYSKSIISTFKCPHKPRIPFLKTWLCLSKSEPLLYYFFFFFFLLWGGVIIHKSYLKVMDLNLHYALCLNVVLSNNNTPFLYIEGLKTTHKKSGYKWHKR